MPVEVGNLEWLTMDVSGLARHLTTPRFSSPTRQRRPPSLLPPVRPQRCQLAGPKPRRTPAHGPQIKNPDKGPSLRTGHSLCVVGLPNNPKAVIIGGCTADGVVNEVWNLKLGVEMLEWESPNIGQPDKAPAPRWRHTATLLRTLRPRPLHVLCWPADAASSC